MAFSDSSIQSSIKSYIHDSMNDTADDINVSTHDGCVLLSGCVNVLAEKIKAEEISKKVEGVKKVENDITISMDGSSSDKQLTDLLNDNLRNCSRHESFVGVTGKVNGGSALLLGEVDSQDDKESAVREATKTFGITNVVDTIKVR
ncbi:osmotically-inducible protein OsmY [Clostridium acetobutylicum]|uniref:Homolog of osmotically induced OSMY protein of E.coli n=1 Tax=Clostridium acetobutylicum (strain ATCC 824 / DSM 792 / JCM 1419 / IAM 19013 / LMG 5710 / NBRC 13948 / NRRL B-527 / VKM B-1787 / 2291 / W) TaxID=272562 RepID=Q97LW4_CLOAB|nr:MULTISPECIES: BON domain-containing protein [Clostridium]AAK78420.1 Homolog of osmotically induced OSMY protein of E.coli [Clostridium acetobutylicum ATCC 824]ADZ19490.1 Conserved hypothetical protein [Clostridium acetobutylicum EA 2018]AEI33647.1 hypothetical protein SMB_G0449 [Clostridium acetobutylicum DSM 1731]AWV80142.1 BON domain-containing protein [Clostridium acetobutylicum]KHD37785.1 hypothetical protein NL50_06295 [Clostridium acetobutylicum]